MWRAAVCLLLAGCGPVLLGEEQAAPAAGANGHAGMQGEPTAMGDASVPSLGSGLHDAGRPTVVVRIKPVDCGKCFDLQAEGQGGQAPYAFEWADGSRDAQRRVCVEDSGVSLSVVAIDATNSQSAPHTLQLESAGDGGCPPNEPAAGAAAPPPGLCLENPSFEGTPALNLGGQTTFDAPPWSACTNPMWDNTPDIGNDTIAVTGDVPPPRDGLTYVALGEGEQVSQELCSVLQAGEAIHLELDLARVDLGELVPQTEQVFLELWGGLSADCSLQERLWASPSLRTGWTRYCITLRPTALTTQLTLRANADMTSLSPGYLLVDNLQPVDSCP